jgi:uncharacterized membrane protein
MAFMCRNEKTTLKGGGGVKCAKDRQILPNCGGLTPDAGTMPGQKRHPVGRLSRDRKIRTRQTAQQGTLRRSFMVKNNPGSPLARTESPQSRPFGQTGLPGSSSRLPLQTEIGFVSLGRMGIGSAPAIDDLQKSIFHWAHPLHPRLIGSGAALLIAALATDLLYVNTLLFQWDNFSIWLLTGGLVLAALAGLALVLDMVSHRITGIDWLRFSGFTAAALLSLLNALVHSRDAYTAVAPEGLALSALVAAILVITGWRGWSVGALHASRPIISEETD